MIQLAALAGLLAVATPQGQVKMDVLVQGHEAGTATLSQRLTENGGKYTELGIVIRSGDDTITVRSQTTLDAKGAPIRMFQQTIRSGSSKSSHEVIVSFDQLGANVVIDDNGDRTTKIIQAPNYPSREDSSEFWFVIDHPDVGASVKALKFDMDALKWDVVTTTFRGVRPMTINGQRVIANVADSQQGTEYLDSEGLPLRIEMPNATLERVWEKQDSDTKP